MIGATWVEMASLLYSVPSCVNCMRRSPEIVVSHERTTNLHTKLCRYWRNSYDMVKEAMVWVDQCCTKVKRARPIVYKVPQRQRAPGADRARHIGHFISLASITRLPRLYAKSYVRTPNFSRSLTTIASQLHTHNLVADNRYRNHGYRIDCPV